MVLVRLNLITLGWANYFTHAVAKHRFSYLDDFTWWRLIRMMRARHHWRWKDVRHWLVTPSGRWRPINADDARAGQDVVLAPLIIGRVWS